MTILLHGENIVASRNRLMELKTLPDSEVTEAKSTDLVVEKIAQLTTPNSLFSKNRLLVIWEDKKLTSSQIKKIQDTIPDLKIEEFKLDPVVFRFLEALKPGGQKTFFPLWLEYLKNEAPEIAATMLARQFRFLLLSKLDQGSTPDDFRNLAPWQLSRLKKQADLFSAKQLQTILQKFLEIDYQVKTGKGACDLQTSLELFLFSL